MINFRQWIRMGLLTSLAVSGWLWTGSAFRAETVECYTQFGRCPDQYLPELADLTGTHLLRPLPVSVVNDRLVAGFPEVSRVKMYRRLPATLIVSLMLRRPLGALSPRVLGARYAADEEGYIFQQTDSLALPLLLVERNLQLGDRLNVDQLSALKLLENVSQLASGPVTGRLSGTRLDAYLTDDRQVVFDLHHLQPEWKATLQVILSGSKIQSKIPKVIDLRFSDPVITF